MEACCLVWHVAEGRLFHGHISVHPVLQEVYSYIVLQISSSCKTSSIVSDHKKSVLHFDASHVIDIVVRSISKDALESVLINASQEPIEVVWIQLDRSLATSSEPCRCIRIASFRAIRCPRHSLILATLDFDELNRCAHTFEDVL